MEKKAISAPEKNADSPRQMKTAIKSMGGLACSDQAMTGGSACSYQDRRTNDEGVWNQKMLRGIDSLTRACIDDAMS